MKYTKRWQKQAVRGLVFWGLKGIALISRLFPWQWGVRFGGYLGRASFHFLSKERRTAQANIKMALGNERSPDELNRILRSNFENLGKGLIEILNMSRLRREELEELVELEGEEHLKRAYAEGQGVILITGHIGNWELMGAFLAHRGYPLHVIAAPLYDPRIDEWINQSRALFDIQTISRGTPSSSRKILAVLRKREILGLLIDQDTRVEGVFVDFFNRKAYTPSGAASLALRSGAVTLTCFIIRLPGNRHRITIQKPISLISTGDYQKDLVLNTALFTRSIEDYVRHYPEQWVWMHRRWKTEETSS
jgi:KDO2-lipid IV(A) lauroyltransferase